MRHGACARAGGVEDGLGDGGMCVFRNPRDMAA